MAWISHRLSSLYFGAKGSSDEVNGDDSDIPTGEAVNASDQLRMWLPYDRLQDQIVSDACCEDIYDKAKLVQLEEMQGKEGSSAHLEQVESDDDDDDDEGEVEDNDDENDEFEGCGDEYNFF